jgi:trans-aconitate methyltransferase
VGLIEMSLRREEATGQPLWRILFVWPLAIFRFTTTLCGTGYYTRSIAGRADHVLATDLSDEMLAVVASQLPRLDKVTIQGAIAPPTR